MSDSSTDLFPRFRSARRADAGSRGPFPEWTTADTIALLGRDEPALTAFVATAAATSFEAGAFFPLPPTGSVSLAGLNGRGGWAEDWPGFESLAAFAYDWLGRLYVLESAKGPVGSVVARVEPEIGELTETGVPLGEFLNEFLVDDFDDVVATGLRSEYLGSGRPKPGPGQIVGYEVPLFLGGSDSIENMAPVDFRVYLSLSGQLATQANAVTPGSRVGRVNLSRD